MGSYGFSTVVEGFADYADSLTPVTPINLAANTWTTLTNNGLGSSTNLGFMPLGVTQLFDTAANRYIFSQLKLGDAVWIRPDFEVTPTNNNTLIEVQYLVGQSGQEYTLVKSLPRMDKGAGVPVRFTYTDMIYIGDNNTRLGGSLYQVRLSGTGTVKNYGSAIVVVRK